MKCVYFFRIYALIIFYWALSERENLRNSKINLYILFSWLNVGVGF